MPGLARSLREPGPDNGSARQSCQAYARSAESAVGAGGRMSREVVPLADQVEVPVIVEQCEQGYLAYNDDIRVSASGASEQEALANFQAAVRDLVAAFGREALRDIRPLVTRTVTV